MSEVLYPLNMPSHHGWVNESGNTVQVANSINDPWQSTDEDATYIEQSFLYLEPGGPYVSLQPAVGGDYQKITVRFRGKKVSGTYDPLVHWYMADQNGDDNYNDFRYVKGSFRVSLSEYTNFEFTFWGLFTHELLQFPRLYFTYSTSSQLRLTAMNVLVHDPVASASGVYGGEALFASNPVCVPRRRLFVFPY